MKPSYLFLLVLVVPNISHAYVANFSGYNTKNCTYFSFEDFNLDSGRRGEIRGFSQPVEGNGNATNFHGQFSRKQNEWAFFGGPEFPLAGTTYRETSPNSGVFECIKGCSLNGIKYILEYSREEEEKRYEKHKAQVQKLCPSIFR